ncbi:MAG TPA: class F sortase, partial [Streptosporangiaceae bacterium]|nr:class F sortase [Streptosporangiaceae bacterium]
GSTMPGKHRKPRPVRPGRWLFCAAFLACARITTIVVSQHTHRWAAPPVPPASIALQAQQPVLPAEPSIVAPSLSAASPSAASPSAAASAQAPRPRRELNPAPLRRSLPLTVRIPAIGVDARIIPLGLGPDDIVNVPPLTTPMLTSWFDGGVTPGQAGPAVLFGHVDSAVTGPAVFYRLGDLRPGNLVYVTRADHRTAVFQVDAVDLYSENSFPDTAIYASTAAPVLRLITCGGQFDTKTHLYLDRTVAYARYLGQLR